MKQYRLDWDALDDFTGGWIPCWRESYDKASIENQHAWHAGVAHVRNSRMTERDLGPWRPLD